MSGQAIRKDREGRKHGMLEDSVLFQKLAEQQRKNASQTAKGIVCLEWHQKNEWPKPGGFQEQRKSS